MNKSETQKAEVAPELRAFRPGTRYKLMNESQRDKALDQAIADDLVELQDELESFSKLQTTDETTSEVKALDRARTYNAKALTIAIVASEVLALAELRAKFVAALESNAVDEAITEARKEATAKAYAEAISQNH